MKPKLLPPAPSGHSRFSPRRGARRPCGPVSASRMDDAALNGGCRSLRAVLHVDFDAETQR